MLCPLRIVHVVTGQQDLGHGAIVFGEQLVVNVHHPALAHGGGRLLHPQLLWPLRKPQFGGAHGDGTGGHQNDLMSHAAEIGQCADQMLHAPQVQTAGVMGQGGGAYLHDNTLLCMFHGSSPPDM